MTKDSVSDSSTGLVITNSSSSSDKEEVLNDILSPLKPEKQENSLPENINKICNEDSSCTDSPKSIANLTEGILTMYAGDCQKIQGNLQELMKSQKILLETVQQENSRFLEMKAQYSLDDIFARSRHYHTKLIQIKKDMASLTEKAAKLKRRSLRLQEQKQREALLREQSREREIEKEKQLLAKVVSRP